MRSRNLLTLLAASLALVSPTSPARAASPLDGWTPPVRATRPYLLCALYPHLRDAYWLSVNQGMVEEARRLGVRLEVQEAGGYEAQEEQQRQIAGCQAQGADAILLGSVTPDALAGTIRASRVPVFGVVNALAPGLAVAEVGVDWSEMGARIGQWLARRHPAGSPAVRVALFPGPAERGGNNLVEPAFANAIAGSAVTLVTTRRGDNSREIQRTLVQQVLRQYPDLDYLVGGAIAAEVAMSELSGRPRPAIAATYFSHGVQRGLLRGRILVANSDQMRLQGRLAVAQAVCLLNQPDASEARCPRHLAPPILTLERALPDTRDSLSDGDFRPVYRIASEKSGP